MSVFIDLLIDFVYPKMCAACNKMGTFLCDECMTKLNYADQICPNCGEESAFGWSHKECVGKYGLDGLVSIYNYQDEGVREIINEIKFGFNKELIEILLDKCEVELGTEFDVIVPIPLFYYRQNWRGFNQSEEMGKVLGRRLGIEVGLVLARKRATKQQSLSQRVEDRRENINGAFSLMDKDGVKDKKILLVDDVFTSGATVLEAGRELKKGGASMVWGLCLAH